jgi:hypothetical protein
MVPGGRREWNVDGRYPAALKDCDDLVQLVALGSECRNDNGNHRTKRSRPAGLSYPPLASSRMAITSRATVEANSRVSVAMKARLQWLAPHSQ